MLCARVMRGSSSRAKAAIPVGAACWTSWGEERGSSVPTSAWPRRRRERSPKPRTRSSTAASA
jgi:hypothetical protein